MGCLWATVASCNLRPPGSLVGPAGSLAPLKSHTFTHTLCCSQQLWAATAPLGPPVRVCWAPIRRGASTSCLPPLVCQVQRRAGGRQSAGALASLDWELCRPHKERNSCRSGRASATLASTARVCLWLCLCTASQKQGLGWPACRARAVHSTAHCIHCTLSL